MLGSAKTNLPLLTLTSWVKGTSSFGLVVMFVVVDAVFVVVVVLMAAMVDSDQCLLGGCWCFSWTNSSPASASTSRLPSTCKNYLVLPSVMPFWALVLERVYMLKGYSSTAGPLTVSLPPLAQSFPWRSRPLDASVSRKNFELLINV